MPKTLSATPTRAPGQRSRQQHSGQPHHQPREQRATPINHNWLTTAEAAARLRPHRPQVRLALANLPGIRVDLACLTCGLRPARCRLRSHSSGKRLTWLEETRAMTARFETRRGERVLILDIPYRRPDGTSARYRRDSTAATLTLLKPTAHQKPA
jgi:hypothetical protein